MAQKVINVDLYGGKGIFGGRETPLEAVVTKCDMHEQCSFYQEGHCLNIRDINRKGCKHGDNQVVKGYTSRAQKYWQFKDKWKEHEQYHQLSQPKKTVGRIADEVVVTMSYLNLQPNEDTGRWEFKKPMMFANSVSFIPYDEFDADFILKICKHRPQAMMGGEIKEYQQEKVPLFLAHLKETLPEKYSEFVQAYPEYDTEIDHNGRKAYLRTLLPSRVHYRSSNFTETWAWDGEYLHLIEKQSLRVNIADKYEVEQFVIKPAEDTIVTISSNEQVGEDTVFVS